MGKIIYLITVEEYGFGLKPVDLTHCPLRRNNKQPEHEWCVSKNGENFCSVLTKQGTVRVKHLKNGHTLLECMGGLE